MAAKHGKTTSTVINALNISPHTRNAEWKRAADTHDVTGYKADDTDTAKNYIAGLTDGTVTLSGMYDTSATTGPAKVLEDCIAAGVAVDFEYAVEGLGTGKPMRECQVIVQTYNETSPVADIVTWTSDLQITGAVARTTQA
jgi:hypothetical protein